MEYTMGVGRQCARHCTADDLDCDTTSGEVFTRCGLRKVTY